MRTYLVSHIDLDGYGCNIFAVKYLQCDAIFNVDYEDIAKCLCDIPRDSHLIITDLSIPENIQGLIEEFEQVSIIDHHVSTYWAVEAFSGRLGFDVTVSKERCATWLFYDWIDGHGFSKPESKKWAYEWARYIDDYDRYVLQYPESDRLNSLLYISNRDRFVSDAQINTPLQVLKANADRIDRYLANQQEYIDECVKICLSLNITDGCQHDVYLVFAEKYKSKIAKQLIEQKGAELVYVLNMRTFQASIRSSRESHIDCSQIAKSLDPQGGGHRNSAGFRLKVPPEECGLDQSAIWEALNLPINDLPIYGEEDEE